MIARNYFWLVTALAMACFAPGVAAQVASGTAFTVAPGLLVTNQHVIAGCSNIDVFAADGRRTGSIVDADAQIDLALLRVSGLKGAIARLRSPRTIRLGESVMVFGFPLTGSLSSSGNFTTGVVSALRGLRDAAGELQITAPVQPGNSGGPLMDASGLIVGVVQSKLNALRSAIVTGDIPQNVNFAISLEAVADFLVKNKVSIRDAAISAPLDTARVAELAQGFTYRIECRGRVQQTTLSPTLKQGELPPCPGSFKTATWTNCVGEITFSDGLKYVGGFKDNKFHGQGTSLSNGVKYVGEFRDNMWNGQGISTLPDGTKYVGEFRDNKWNGRGIITLPNGVKYAGEFRDSKFHGQGTTYDAAGSILHSGVWENGSVLGTKQASIKKDSLPPCLSGIWNMCVGTFEYSNGAKYVGEYKDNAMNGQGTLYDANGSILQSGIWKNGIYIGSR